MKSLKVRLVVFFMVLIAVGTFSSGFVIYRNYIQYLDQSIDDRLKAAVYASNEAVDFTLVNSLLIEDGNKSDKYLEQLEKLHTLKERLNLEYIYNLTPTGIDEWKFIFDSADLFPEDEEDLSFNQVYEVDEEMFNAIELKDAYVTMDYYTDQWGTFKTAYFPVFDENDELITVIGADIEASITEEMKRRVFLVFILSVIIAVLITGLVAIWIARQIIKPLDLTTKSLEEIASGEGDLTKRLHKDTDNEIGRMVDSYNNFQDSLKDMLFRIVGSAETLKATGTRLSENMFENASAVEEIVSNIVSINKQVKNQSNSVNDSTMVVNQIHEMVQRLGNVILNQSASITESSAAIEEMTGNIQAVSKNMDTLSGYFKELEGFSDEGKVKIADVMDQVQSISIKSQALQEANTIIAGIAAQTNLLAMNAAIEAAHAGESGRGFSVVADEIRKLAEQSAIQSKSIGASLKEVLNSIAAVVSSTSETEKTFEKVMSHVTLIAPLETQVKEALVEQRAGGAQILEALGTMNDITVEVTEGSSEIKSGSDSLLTEVEKLNRITGEVTHSMMEIESGVQRIQSTTNSGEELVRENQTSIEEVLAETGRFKLKE